MPAARNGDVTLYYEAHGGGEPVVFVSDLGYGAWLWSWQAPALAGPYRTIVWDTRGTGRSDAPPGPYAIGDLAADLEAVLADADARRAMVVGAGLGGMVALDHALSFDRTDRLVLLGTTARGAEMDAAAMATPPDDLDAVTSPQFRREHPEAVAQIAAWRAAEDAGTAARRAQIDAVSGFDVSDRLHEIGVPALVLHGEADAVVPVEAGEALAEGLPRGTFERFRDEPHLFFVEQSRLATDAIADFLEGGSPPSSGTVG